MRWLLDAMLPPQTAKELSTLRHEAVSVLDIGMGAATDAEVFDVAVHEDRVTVTENFADFAILLRDRQTHDEPCVPVVFVRRDSLPRRGALAVHLCKRLDTWATANLEPFIGLHWP